MEDGRTGVNVMLLVMFEKLGYRESELMKTNTSMNAFKGKSLTQRVCYRWS
jgi:hypothetical protein